MLHDVIKMMMKMQGLTYSDLSQKSEVSIGTLNKILSGTSKSPRLETVEAIAKALDCTIDELNRYDKMARQSVAKEDEEADSIIKMYNALSDDDKLFIGDMLSRLSKKP